MDVRQLEYFVAVAEELNFTRAAARCHVVQSALSYQIARLERAHGVVLFERTSRSVRLAPAGRVLLPRARAVLAELALARSELAALTGLVTGQLRVGMIGSAGRAAPEVVTALAAFHERYPAVEITIRDTGSAAMAEQVRAGGLDLAFVGLPPGDVPDELAARLVADEPLVVAVGSAHPWAARAEPVDPVELTEQGPLVDMRPESGVRRQVDAVFVRAGVTRVVAFELATSDAVVSMVASGLGIAVVPRSATDAGTVVALALTDPLARHPTCLVHRAPRPAAPSAQAFLDLLTTKSPGHGFRPLPHRGKAISNALIDRIRGEEDQGEEDQ